MFAFTKRLANSKVTSSKEEIDLCFARFYERFPTEAHRQEALFQTAAPMGVRCQCGVLSTHRKFGERNVRCLQCKKMNSATANTFFHGVKKITAHVAAIFLSGNGIAISANAFSKRVGISQSAADDIFHGISHLVMKNMTNAKKLLSAALRAIVGKRSKETPAREHPFAEQEEEEKRAAEKRKANADRDGHSQEDGPKDEIEQQIYRLLLPVTLHFDVLLEKTKLPVSTLSAKLSMLELFGYVKSLPGNTFRALQNLEEGQSQIRDVAAKANIESNPVKKFFQFVRATYHRISRKYAQRYSARYWCYVDRQRWSFESLLEVCAQAERLSHAQLISYVSPLAIDVIFEPDS